MKNVLAIEKLRGLTSEVYGDLEEISKDTEKLKIVKDLDLKAHLEKILQKLGNLRSQISDKPLENLELTTKLINRTGDGYVLTDLLKQVIFVYKSTEKGDSDVDRTNSTLCQNAIFLIISFVKGVRSSFGTPEEGKVTNPVISDLVREVLGLLADNYYQHTEESIRFVITLTSIIAEG